MHLSGIVYILQHNFRIFIFVYLRRILTGSQLIRILPAIQVLRRHSRMTLFVELWSKGAAVHSHLLSNSNELAASTHPILLGMDYALNVWM